MQENQCKFVSSRGLLKSCDIYSFTPISSIRHLINYDFSNLKDGSIIYICSSALPFFIQNYFEKILFQIILVTGDCDETCWIDLFSSYDQFINFIENKKIIHWFSQNCIIEHKKISQIPIGLDYHTMTNHYPLWGPKLSPMQQEEILNNIRNHIDFKPFWLREIKCYSNFHFQMKTKYAYDRKEAFENIAKDLVFYEPMHLLREQSWINQSKFSFVISPHGNGLDCHRTWEALVLGCIPIVKTSGLDSLYKDLPVLIVKEWKDINKKLLKDTIKEFRIKKFNYDQLLLSFWIEKIKEKKQV